MSTCISAHGEYSSHELDATFTCTLCGVLDEDALRAELVRIQEELDGARNDYTMLREKQLRRAYEANDGLKAQLKEREAELDRLNAELAEARRRECTALCTDVEHERDQLNIALAEARRERDEAVEAQRITAAVLRQVEPVVEAATAMVNADRDGNYYLHTAAWQTLQAAVDALPSSSDGAGLKDETFGVGTVLKGASGAEYTITGTIGTQPFTPTSECDAPGGGGAYLGPGGKTYCRCVVCSRCGHHTGNSNQGHYWKFCSVTKTSREFHLCCPGDCELEAAASVSAPGEVANG